MDVYEIREMTDEEIEDAIEDSKRALFNLRFQKASGQLEDTSILKQTKKSIAQLKTVLHERELAAELIAVNEEDDNGE